MKELLALALSFSMISAPVYAQDDESAPAEETTDEAAAPADETEVKQPEKTENSATEGAADEKSSTEAKDAPEPEKKVIDETGAPPKGTGKWVTGIAVASAGTMLGISILALSRIDCKDAFKDADDLDDDDDVDEKKKNDDNIRNCEKNKPNYRRFGTVFLIGGVGVGVPLIYFGLAERRVYKDWRAAKEAEQASNTRRSSGHADLVLLPNTQNGVSPGLSLTYTF